MDYEKIVIDAAKWLDGVEPGWWRRIDPKRLDMMSCEDCIWGQLLGNFRVGVALYGDIFHCFQGPVFACISFQPFWLAEISARLEADKSTQAQERFVEYTHKIINEKAEEPCLTNAS